jgi:WW domain-binding protein 4
MTEFWKSGERHFCTFCKCWLAGNKISIDLHESGNHHKSMVKAKLEQLRKSNIEKERQEKQLNATLGQMDRAANESFRRDMVANATSLLNNSQQNIPGTSDANLPSKLKRPLNHPVQVQCKKPKFVIKTPTPTPVFEPITTTSPSETKEEENEFIEAEKSKTSKEEIKDKSTTNNNNNHEGTWYESKTETQESFYWNDTTGESTWTPPAVYLSIEQQRAKGLKV